MALLTMADRLGRADLDGPVFKIGGFADACSRSEWQIQMPTYVRLPFDALWFESDWIDGGRAKTGFLGVAVHVSSFSVDDVDERCGSGAAWTLDRIPWTEAPSRVLVFTSFVESSLNRFRDPVTAMVPVSDDWRPISSEDGAQAVGITDVGSYPRALPGLVAPPMFALGALNCANIRRIEHLPRPKLSRRCELVYGRPASKYYTLAIDPLAPKNARSADSRGDEESDNRALHLCRGHFADYRNGNGLFGKHRGLFWVRPHMRGTAERGVVVKDYEILGPD